MRRVQAFSLLRVPSSLRYRQSWRSLGQSQSAATTTSFNKARYSCLAVNDDDTIFPEEHSDRCDQLMSASKLSLAPMMEYTDRHFRHLVRLISSQTLLYTEMVPVNALAHRRKHHLESDELCETDDLVRRSLAQSRVDPLEGPSVLQLGGSDPEQVRMAAETVYDMTQLGWCNYTAINLNCGCPSPRVAGKGNFGAALMDSPQLVAELVEALHEGTNATIPINVKCRIGTDTQVPFSPLSYATQQDSEREYQQLCRFIETVASDGIVTDFCVHARLAVLRKSFSPADNRKIPPLRYDYVRRLVQDFPDLTFTLNGGIDNLSQTLEEFRKCPGLNGVMVGRGWVADPWSFALTDQLLYRLPSRESGDDRTSVMPKNRLEVLQAYGRHADYEETIHEPSKVRRFLIRAVTNLFAGERNAKRYRIALDQGCRTKWNQGGDNDGATTTAPLPASEVILRAALQNIPEEILLETPDETIHRRMLAESERTISGALWAGRSQAVSEWQQEHKKTKIDNP